MANLTLTRQWIENIYELATTDPVMGGPDGVDNRQAKELGARTNWLKDQVDGINRERTGYAPKANPAFSGVPTAPTANPNTNNTQIATTAFVKTAIAALVGSAPATLDTLAEIAHALAGDANVKATLLAEIAKKANANHTHTSGQITDFTNAVNGIINRDFTYQKIGNFEIRKYPDGTMIQTCRFNPPNNRVGAQDKKFTFNWAVAFVEKPKIFIQHQNHERSGYGSLDMVMNTVEHETTNSQVAFWVWEWYYNNNLISFDFLAIGRWK